MMTTTMIDDSLFSCPVIDDQDATNDGGESFEEYYGKVSRKIITDKTEFLKSFRTDKYINTMDGGNLMTK